MAKLLKRVQKAIILHFVGVQVSHKGTVPFRELGPWLKEVAAESSSPKDHIDTDISQAMVSGILLLSWAST